MAFVFRNTGPGVSVDIVVDIPKDFINDEEFHKRLPSVIEEAVLEAAVFWESEAGRRLKTSRERYQAAIHVDTDGATSQIVLKDPFAVMIETGTSGWNMKEQFLRSPKARTGAIKMPRAVAAGLIKGAPPSRRIVVPINGNRQAPFTQPTAFRTVTDKQPASMWNHPGVTGVDIASDVIHELETNILPRHIGALIDEVLIK